MKILFIGGTGNISSECVNRCLKQGHRVSVITRGKSLLQSGAEAIIADRYDFDSFARAVSGKSFDVVINFLGYKLPELEIDFKLFNGQIEQYIFISSATVYKKPHSVLPITEDYELGNPFSEYAQNKQKCEEWLMKKMEKNGFPITIVRPSHTYSEKWLPNILSSSTWTIPARMLSKKPLFLHDGGKSLWTITTSRDFSKGLCGLIGTAESVGEAFHITSDEANSWKAIYDRYAIELGLEPPKYINISTDELCNKFPEFIANLKGDKAENAVFDNTKIKRFVPDFSCEESMIEGIRRSMQWFKEDTSRQNIDRDIFMKIDNIIQTCKGE